MDFATDGLCNCKVSVLLLAQFFLGGYRHSGRVLRTPILPLGKKPKSLLVLPVKFQAAVFLGLGSSLRGRLDILSLWRQDPKTVEISHHRHLALTNLLLARERASQQAQFAVAELLLTCCGRGRSRV